MLADTILALFIASFVCAALCPTMIPILHHMRPGQQVRDDGPQSHSKKSGMPIMGGIMIALAIALGCLSLLKKTPETLPVMGSTLTFGFIGFLDGFLKIHREQSEGPKIWQKFSLQFIVTGILVYRLFRTRNYGGILLPSSGSFETGILLPFGGFFVPFAFLVVLGTDNGANFIDGLDGFYSPATAVVAFFLIVVACHFAPGTAPISGAVTGALFGFLLFNCYPAEAFMGDTGALALGGYAAAVALMFRMPLFLVLVGIIYILEMISVMLQVGYFKATKGKWLFRMAPLHHRFELGGWSKTCAVTVFTIYTVISSLTAWIGPGE